MKESNYLQPTSAKPRKVARKVVQWKSTHRARRIFDIEVAVRDRDVDPEWPRLEAGRYQAQSPRGGGTNRRDCRSYACANASIRASVPGRPTIERFIAGILSAPKPAGMDTSGSPSQLP